MNIGDQVKRTNGANYERGNVGTVIELDEQKQRARISWTHNNEGDLFAYPKPRTWMAYKYLSMASTKQTG